MAAFFPEARTRCPRLAAAALVCFLARPSGGSVEGIELWRLKPDWSGLDHVSEFAWPTQRLDVAGDFVVSGSDEGGVRFFRLRP